MPFRDAIPPLRCINTLHIVASLIGLSSHVIYPNGISCTLPEDMQQRLVRTIAGLENATMLQPGENFVSASVVNAFVATW